MMTLNDDVHISIAITINDDVHISIAITMDALPNE